MFQIFSLPCPSITLSLSPPPLPTCSPTLEAAYCSNEEGSAVRSLQSGIYGLSNDQLDSPWRKVSQGKERFTALVSALQDGSVERKESEQQLLDLLCDDTWSVGTYYFLSCLKVFCELAQNAKFVHTNIISL